MHLNGLHVHLTCGLWSHQCRDANSCCCVAFAETWEGRYLVVDMQLVVLPGLQGLIHSRVTLHCCISQDGASAGKQIWYQSCLVKEHRIITRQILNLNEKKTSITDRWVTLTELGVTTALGSPPIPLNSSSDSSLIGWSQPARLWFPG